MWPRVLSHMYGYTIRIMSNHSQIHGKTIEEWISETPVISDLMITAETLWFPSEISDAAMSTSTTTVEDRGLTPGLVQEASDRLDRFAPYLAQQFPETEDAGGIIESPLVAGAAFARQIGLQDPSSLYLKLDSHLPVSGSIKARGGIYEVLAHAEKLAVEAGKLSYNDDYQILGTEEFTDFFGNYSVAVGSTGNLGLSIGIISAALGFNVTVHMSADARQWKKDMLRELGVIVREYESDYAAAVAQGRIEAEADPTCHFVDDEDSLDLFLGYAVAGKRVAEQLASGSVVVDALHPLYVYLPCGVGGGPGGVAYGLFCQFGDAVHPIFVEPTHAPCMTLGVATALHECIDVRDFGIDLSTAADGLACPSPSGLVSRILTETVPNVGFMTVSDDTLFKKTALLYETEGLRIEPSAAAGLAGPARITSALSAEDLENATHICWLTGGAMVPEAEMDSYLAQGRGILHRR